MGSVGGWSSRRQDLEVVQLWDADSIAMRSTDGKINLGIKCMGRGGRRNENFAGLCFPSLFI